jgi:hypothetical protein
MGASRSSPRADRTVEGARVEVQRFEPDELAKKRMDLDVEVYAFAIDAPRKSQVVSSSHWRRGDHWFSRRRK